MTRKRYISWLVAVVLLVLPLEVIAAATAPSAGDTLAAKAVASMEELESYQKYVDQISVSDLSDLPVGLKKKYGFDLLFDDEAELQCNPICNGGG